MDVPQPYFSSAISFYQGYKKTRAILLSLCQYLQKKKKKSPKCLLFKVQSIAYSYLTVPLNK